MNFREALLQTVIVLSAVSAYGQSANAACINLAGTFQFASADGLLRFLTVKQSLSGSAPVYNLTEVSRTLGTYIADGKPHTTPDGLVTYTATCTATQLTIQKSQPIVNDNGGGEAVLTTTQTYALNNLRQLSVTINGQANWIHGVATQSSGQYSYIKLF